MANLIERLQGIIKPGGGLLDTGWLEKLPRHDYLAAQDIVVERLEAFVSGPNPLHRDSLQTLFTIDERCRENIAALTKQYATTPSLPFEVDDRLWQSVNRHFLALASAYQAFLDHYGGSLARSPIADDVPQLLLNLVDTLRCAAKWHYLRFQSIEPGGWLRIHRLYQFGENWGCTKTLLRRFRGQAETTLMACYLQALMLDTLNHTSMLKVEIEMLANWLSGWCRSMELETTYTEPYHLFFVNLDEDRGGRRIRYFQLSRSHRYWDTDSVVGQVQRLSEHLQQGRMPDNLQLAANVTIADCRLLADHMLVEWSRIFFRRQRRKEDRSQVTMEAKVVHGILGVCQHIKNAAYSRGGPEQYENLNIRPLPTDLDRSSEAKKDIHSDSEEDFATWTITSQSLHGFGAVVNADMNLWLRPGKIIVLDYEMNSGMPVIGVVRSVQQQLGNRRQVGIEVICHTPVYVRMKELAEGSQSQEFLPTDVFLAMALSTQGQSPFPALYLPEDEGKGTPSSLLLPRSDYVAGGLYELRTESHHAQTRLGRVLEQRDDWVRVEVVLHGDEPSAD